MPHENPRPALTNPMIAWLALALLSSLSTLAFAYNGEDDEPQLPNLYAADEKNFQLFDNVVHFDEQESEEFFSFVSGKDETEPESPSLTLYLDRLPEKLEGVRSGKILAAAVTPSERLDHSPTENTRYQPNASDWLALNGLLHHVVALEETDEGWQLQLRQATLADTIKVGTLIVEASTMIVSREEVFGSERYIYQEGDHYRKVSMHQEDMHCTPGQFQVDTVSEIMLPGGIDADISYSAVLQLRYALSFDNRRVEHVELNAEICQAGSLTLRAENEINREWLLWRGQSRTQVFRVGLLPIVARAGASLTYGLSAGAEFSQPEPILLKHRLERQASRSQGSWQVTSPTLAPPTVHVPDSVLQIDVESTSKLIPQLEVILYGLAGPYIQATGATTAGLHSQTFSPSLMAGLTLQAGIQQARDIVSLCQQGDCEKRLGSCEWEWDFYQSAFQGPGCTWMGD